MLLFKKNKDLALELALHKAEGKTVGFVPTMGALHEGHLSLIRRAKKETDVVVCSIFINPSQFNDASDLEKYPRTPAQDTALLLDVGCDILYMPAVEEVYPPLLKLPAPPDLGYLAKPMEGAHRPGHFEGMAQVVRRLLDIVNPEKLFMGQKDFQQFTIVRHMLYQLKSKVEIVLCPIVREADGLAMSSRNVRLTPEQRQLAPLIFKILSGAKEKVHSHFPKDIMREALEQLSVHGMVPEYFDIVDGHSLEPLDLFEDTDYAVACTAVNLGGIRLIDNLILKGG
ncbi:MAG: pantoate--beta-alanine ligase [Lewinellaceae bacterium]|nr:pantoate--beta-alanine ligase [Saprospiraceae bacterium]MCB9339794.1 pantoate--beta-alanine ligase [Lewinellaceae bacterium]